MYRQTILSGRPPIQTMMTPEHPVQTMITPEHPVQTVITSLHPVNAHHPVHHLPVQSGECTSTVPSLPVIPQSTGVLPPRPHKVSPAQSEGLPYHPSLVMLPPCAVCDEKSAGFHYGANTCEACKGFFRRCLTKQVPPCKLDNNCDVSYRRRRNGCISCRYQKCLKAGMSKNAIKIGRHTYEKRTRDIQEVKRMELQDMLTKDGARLRLVNREEEMERIIEKMTNITKDWSGRSNQELEALMNAEQQYLEKKQLEETIFGSRKPLTREEYRAIFEQTGIDADGRKTKSASMVPYVEKKLENFISFSNSLPGFAQLPPKDQKLLAKGSALERWVFIFSFWYNVDANLFSCTSDNNICSVEDMVHFTDDPDHGGQPGAESLMDVWRIIGQYQKLELTEAESILAAAVSVMCADCDDLSDIARQVSLASSDYLVEALAYLISKNHDPEEGTLGKIINIMCELRQYHPFYVAMQRTFIHENIDMGIPELFLEYMV